MDLIDQHLEHGKGTGKKDKTKSQWSRAVRHLVDAIGNVQLRDVKHHHYVKLMDHLRDRERSESTVVNALTSCGKLLTDAAKLRWIAVSPWRDIDMPRKPISVPD